jgi:hypothetical protein
MNRLNLKLGRHLLAAGVAFALAGVCAAAAPPDRVPGKAAKPVEIEKNVMKPAAPAAPSTLAKPTIPDGKKKAVGGKRGGVPDDSI